MALASLWNVLPKLQERSEYICIFSLRAITRTVATSIIKEHVGTYFSCACLMNCCKCTVGCSLNEILAHVFSLRRTLRKHIDTLKINILYQKLAGAHHFPRTSSQIKRLALCECLAWITKLFRRTLHQNFAFYIEPANASKPWKFGQNLLHLGFFILSFSACIWYGNVPSNHCLWKSSFTVAENLRRKNTKSSVPNESENTKHTERHRLW